MLHLCFAMVLLFFTLQLQDCIPLEFLFCFHGIPPVLVIKYGARKDEPLSCKSVCQNLTLGTSVLHRIDNMTVDLGMCMDTQSIEMYFIVYKYILYIYIYV